MNLNMKSKQKSRGFKKYIFGLLRYRKAVTLADWFCNILIFSHRAAVLLLIREILNSIERGQGNTLAESTPFLALLVIAAVIRVGAIMSCAALDFRRGYYYQNRTRMNCLNLLVNKKDVTKINPGHDFEILDDDVPASTFPAEILTEVGGFMVHTLISLGILLSVNWQLTLFIFLPLSAAVVVIQRISERMKERRKVNREAHDAASQFISDITNVAMAVKITGAEAAVLHEYGNINACRREAVVKDTLYNARVSALLQGSVCAGSAIILLIASGMMADGTFGIGDLTLFTSHIFTVADMVLRIVETLCDYKKGEVSYERIIKSVGEEDISKDANITLKHEEPAKKEFTPADFKSFTAKNLSFSYEGGKGFSNVSFSVSPGEIIAVAGGMASGKSVLLSVLIGIMPQDNGVLLWGGGKDFKGLAGAPQHSGFFSGTVKENLCLGWEIPEKDISRAVYISSLEDVGLESSAGSGGGKLSGGQRQRLSLARAMLHGSLCIIDDCVSALDENTRNEVARRIREHITVSGKGLIIATNARQFLEASDRVIFMENGWVKAEGPYRELVAQCGKFASIVQS